MEKPLERAEPLHLAIGESRLDLDAALEDEEDQKQDGHSEDGAGSDARQRRIPPVPPILSARLDERTGPLIGNGDAAGDGLRPAGLQCFEQLLLANRVGGWID